MHDQTMSEWAFDGPFTFPNGRTCYWDNIEGGYVDAHTDHYLTPEEEDALTQPAPNA